MKVMKDKMCFTTLYYHVIVSTLIVFLRGGGGKIGHATQNKVKSARVRTAIILL